MAETQPRKRQFRRYSYRGIDLEELVKMERDEVIPLFGCRQRRRLLQREVPQKYMRFMKKCVQAKKDTPFGEKPAPVKTHLRNAIIFPELVGSLVAIYNGKNFNTVEIKPDMVGHYLAEFSLSYRPVRHGRPGVGASKGSAHVDLK